MSQLYTTKNQNMVSSSQKPEEVSWASDAVDRIARRTPALFKTNQVPSVHARAMPFDHTQTEGAS